MKGGWRGCKKLWSMEHKERRRLQSLERRGIQSKEPLTGHLQLVANLQGSLIHSTSMYGRSALHRRHLETYMIIQIPGDRAGPQT